MSAEALLVVPNNGEQRAVATRLNEALSEFSDELRVVILVSAAWGIARQKGIPRHDFLEFVAQQVRLLEQGREAAIDKMVTVVDPAQLELAIKTGGRFGL